MTTEAGGTLRLSPHFAVGQRVVWRARRTENWNRETFPMTLGRVYKVMSIRDLGAVVGIDTDSGERFHFFPENFDLANPNSGWREGQLLVCTHVSTGTGMPRLGEVCTFRKYCDQGCCLSLVEYTGQLSCTYFAPLWGVVLP